MQNRGHSVFYVAVANSDGYLGTFEPILSKFVHHLPPSDEVIEGTNTQRGQAQSGLGSLKDMPQAAVSSAFHLLQRVQSMAQETVSKQTSRVRTADYVEISDNNDPWTGPEQGEFQPREQQEQQHSYTLDPNPIDDDNELSNTKRLGAFVYQVSFVFHYCECNGLLVVAVTSKYFPLDVAALLTTDVLDSFLDRFGFSEDSLPLEFSSVFRKELKSIVNKHSASLDVDDDELGGSVLVDFPGFHDGYEDESILRSIEGGISSAVSTIGKSASSVRGKAAGAAGALTRQKSSSMAVFDSLPELAIHSESRLPVLLAQSAIPPTEMMNIKRRKPGGMYLPRPHLPHLGRDSRQDNERPELSSSNIGDERFKWKQVPRTILNSYPFALCVGITVVLIMSLFALVGLLMHFGVFPFSELNFGL